MTNCHETYAALKQWRRKSGVPEIPKTSVVSPLFPGQFNYCLDESHWLEKTNSFLDMPFDDHFQKTMPAIRLADFEHFYKGESQPDGTHLATFTIGTVGGGHLVDAEEGNVYYLRALQGMLEFLTEVIGLERNRIVVSYFCGGMTAREIAGTRKTEDQRSKVLTEFVVPVDTCSESALREVGLYWNQRMACNTRDNFLTTNWYVVRAPWGYRNEIFYRMDDGSLLDIATIERLVYAPICEERDGEWYVVGVKPWDRALIIDAIGIERVTLAKQGSGRINDLPELKEMNDIGLTEREAEALRILHRVYTDMRWQQIESKQRRTKLNCLMRILENVPIKKIARALAAHARAYDVIFPDLERGTHATLQELMEYQCRTLPQRSAVT